MTIFDHHRPGLGRALRLVVAASLAVIAFAWVLSAQREQGLVRDEIVYMHSGSRYVDWWLGAVGDGELRTADAITRHFGGGGPTANNREHPPFMKTLFGLSERVFHRGLGWTERITAYRLPSAAMNALLIALVYLFAAAIWGHGAGILAALFTLLLPRAFFHAGLACFDAAVVTTWFAVLYTYLRALSRPRWCWLLGLAYGVALATKHNALLLPAVLAPHYLWVSLAHGRALAGAGGGVGVGAVVRDWRRGLWALRPSAVAAVAVLGPLVAFALWPWLWLDPIGHAVDWIRFHLHHVHYNYEYLGRNWNAPPYPWHVPVVTTLLTVPVVTTVAAGIGAVALVLARRGRIWQALVGAAPDPLTGLGLGSERVRAPVLLLALSAAVSMGPFLFGRAPIFGAEKHWAPAIPSLCILAGVGVLVAARLATRSLVAAGLVRERAPLARLLLSLTLAGAAVAAAAVETVAAQPYALSHYNALAGGAPGGADLGMNRQFWGYAARGVLPWLNRHAPEPGQPDRPVYSHDASPAWGMYRSEGLLAPGLPDAGHEAHGVRRSRIALVIHERHFARHDYLIWDAYGTVQPAYVLTFQGVPLVSVYLRP
ncbi:ArnT family glycosyltransferase [Haliangium sp.]|uniref:ArnT family glycosyltransferase n=1 Tax=Haliangium sp. TaxID=2663208 RepID=UPI003D0D9D4B